MFQFFAVGRAFRNAKAAIETKDYKLAALTVAEIFDAVGLPGEAARVRGLMQGIADADARAIAVNALGAVADLLGGIFGYTPITVAALPDGFAGQDDESRLAAKLGRCADHCDREDAPKATAAAPGPDAAGAIPPELVQALIALAVQFATAWIAKRFGPRAA